MADPTDIKGTHAREFTNHELLTLRVWFDVDQAGNDDLAQRLLNDGLMLEHYTSLLDNDPAKRTPDELRNQMQLAFAFQQTLDEARTFLDKKAKAAGARDMQWWVGKDGTVNYVKPSEGG